MSRTDGRWTDARRTVDGRTADARRTVGGRRSRQMAAWQSLSSLERGPMSSQGRSLPKLCVSAAAPTACAMTRCAIRPKTAKSETPLIRGGAKTEAVLRSLARLLLYGGATVMVGALTRFAFPYPGRRWLYIAAIGLLMAGLALGIVAVTGRSSLPSSIAFVRNGFDGHS
jgi:hypothetical protein